MTIYALSSARGRAGIAVIRLSGPRAEISLNILTGNDKIRPRKATLCWLYHPESQHKIDHALVLWFPAPGSFTGEDVAELHVHGGRAVVEAVFSALAAIEGLRPAEAGEFSRRAFDNGRMDLTEVEGLADLINAETEGQRRQAMRQMEGALGALYEAWRAELLHSLAYFEAAIDFADEDLPEDLTSGIHERISNMVVAIERHMQDGWRGERLRDGLRIAIIGAPNAGKSTLLNALARREAAIVSEEAGTTRDVIDVHLDLNGFPVTVADTAGIRSVAHKVEREGIRRALQRAEEADLKIILVDGRDWPVVDADLAKLIDRRSLVVATKMDLAGDSDLVREGSDNNAGEYGLGLWRLSAKTGLGLEGFLQDLGDIVANLLERSGDEAPPLTRERHRKALIEVVAHLKRYLGTGGDIEIKAEDIRLAARALGRITGLVDVEDVLGVIFSEFCIGK